MKATRAYIASLGTTGVLLAASILMLTVVSTLVAFDGWPSGTLTERVDTLRLEGRAPSIPVSATARPAAAPGGAAGTPAGGTPAAPGSGRAPAGAPVGGGAPGTTVPGAGGGGGVGVGAPALPGPLNETPQIPAIPVPGGNTVKEQVASTTEQTTGSAGNTLGGQVGEIVTTAGQTAADAVRALPVQG